VKLTHAYLEPACDAHGTGPRSDREAEKHTKAERHSTVSSGRPA